MSSECEAVETHEELYLILSLKHSPADGKALWYRHGARGYTTKYSEAGRYTQAEAACHTNGDDIVALGVMDVFDVTEAGTISFAKAKKLGAACPGDHDGHGIGC